MPDNNPPKMGLDMCIKSSRQTCNERLTESDSPQFLPGLCCCYGKKERGRGEKER